ncbi:MAG: N-formylglutamate amidohydrolase [Lentisphaerae bacterium]|nr:N-formylglutamate amidohydrolase [Lentisphaerota bacterium]
MNPESLQRLLLTCEHAANAVPPRWAHLFDSPSARAALSSHRGWDPGAAPLARALSSLTSDLCPRPSVPSLSGTATRLLVELNRSPGHPQFWSEFTRDLPPAEKDDILRDIYAPFRRAARETLDRLAALSPSPVFHLSVHTFTPELDGEIRDADIGLLYDPARPLEIQWADAWESALRPLAPEWRIRRNYPYSGTDDGHVTHLRTVYPPHAYAGLELEVNQTLLVTAPALADAAERLHRALGDSLS